MKSLASRSKNGLSWTREFFELLGPSEDELTEEYVEGFLSPAERIGFERHFLVNEDRRWQVGFVRLLKDRASVTVPRTVRRPAALASADEAERTDARQHLRGWRWLNPLSAGVSLRARPLWTGLLAASVAVFDRRHDLDRGAWRAPRR